MKNVVIPLPAISKLIPWEFLERRLGLLVIVLAVVTTAMTFLYRSDRWVFETLNTGIVMRGLPAPYFVAQAGSAQGIIMGLELISDLLFFALAYWSIYRLTKITMRKKRLLPLGTALVVAGSFTVWDRNIFTSNCINYSPVAVFGYCWDDYDIYGRFALHAWLLNPLYKLSLGVIVAAVLEYLSRSQVGKIRYAVAPLFLTIMGLQRYYSSGGWFNPFNGRGFPLPFLNLHFDPVFFAIDLFLWAAILYPLGRLITRKVLNMKDVLVEK